MKRPKPISPRVHGMLDYSTAAAVAAAPRIMDLPAPASRLFETLAGGYTALSVDANGVARDVWRVARIEYDHLKLPTTHC